MKKYRRLRRPARRSKWAFPALVAAIAIAGYVSAKAAVAPKSQVTVVGNQSVHPH